MTSSIGRAPDGWTQVTTAREAIELLMTGNVVELSLDHDLGDDERFGRGMDVVDFIVIEQEVNRRDLWPRDGIGLHTANPAGRETMARTIRRYAEKAGSMSANPAPAASQSSRSGGEMLRASQGIRQQAIDETKKQGDPQNAIALAIIYLADVIAKKKTG